MQKAACTSDIKVQAAFLPILQSRPFNQQRTVVGVHPRQGAYMGAGFAACENVVDVQAEGQPGGQVVRRARADIGAVRELAEHGREGAAVQITHYQHGFGGSDFPSRLLQIGLPRGGQFRVDGWWRVQGEQASAVQFRFNEREGFARIRFGHNDAATLQRPPAPKRQCKRAVVAVFAAVRIGLAQRLPAGVVQVDFGHGDDIGRGGQNGGAFLCGGRIVQIHVVPQHFQRWRGGGYFRAARWPTQPQPAGQCGNRPKPTLPLHRNSRRCGPQNRVVRQKMREQFGKPKRYDLANGECGQRQPGQKHEAARQPRAKGVFERHIDEWERVWKSSLHILPQVQAAFLSANHRKAACTLFRPYNPL